MPLTAVFADLPDPRMETANKLHTLTDILVTALLETAFGPDHLVMTATHYLFNGTIGLMDAQGGVGGCAGPDIEGPGREVRMNWVYARPDTSKPQGNFLS
jgi:hypothetical protein